jgi:hypothetical protein
MSFSGTVQSDFLKLVRVEEELKDALIDYAGSDFYTLKSNLIEYIKAVYPLDYTSFVESDLGMMLVELVAYVGAVTSLKADMLANECFLPTARSRTNVANLLRLVGVRLKGPISATANAKLTFDTPPSETNEDEITIPAANRVVQVNSDEDGSPLSFVLYKTVNGRVQPADTDASITLYETEAENYTTTGTGSEFQNLVMLEGNLVVEQGQFANTEAVKSVQLTQSPVVEGSIDVYIDSPNSDTSGRYDEVENLYFASGSGSRLFQVDSDDQFRSTVIFGDNNLGISPRVGDTYTITYRTGGGTRGNISPEYINAVLPATINYIGGASDGQTASINGTIENSSVGTGGSNAETVEHAKRYAPLFFRRQDRVVTLQDYKSFANSFISDYGSTGKATASVRRAYSSANIIDVFLLEKASDIQMKKATAAYKEQLLTAIDSKKMLTDEVVAVDGLIRTIDLFITVRVKKELRSQQGIIKSRVRNRVLDFFNVDNTDFGEPFNPQDLVRAIFEDADVVYATVDNVPNPIKVDHNEIIQLNNFEISIVEV